METLTSGSGSPANFSIGGVIGRGLEVWLKNFVPFTVLTGLLYLPVFIYMAVALGGRLTIEKITTLSMVISLGGLIFGLIATGAITFGVFEQMRGRHATLGKCVSVGVSRLLPVLGTGIVAGICIVLGFLALIIPGIIIMCMLYLAVPVTVVERAGVGEALSRSRQLTQGLKGQIFLIMLVFGLLQGGVGFIVEKVLLGGSPDSGAIKLYFVVVVVLALVWSSLQACVNAVAYHDIRGAKEGVDIEQLAAVFE